MELMRMQAEGCHGTQLGAMDVFLDHGFLDVYFFLGGGRWKQPRGFFFENGRPKCKHQNELEGGFRLAILGGSSNAANAW